MFVYTAMNPNGTGLMMLLGLPFVAVSLFVGLAFQESFSGAYIVALIASPFLWSFAYPSTSLVQYLASSKAYLAVPFRRLCVRSHFGRRNNLCCGLTMRSSRNHFVPPNTRQVKLAMCLARYAVRLNLGVRHQMKDFSRQPTRGERALSIVLTAALSILLGCLSIFLAFRGQWIAASIITAIFVATLILFFRAAFGASRALKPREKYAFAWLSLLLGVGSLAIATFIQGCGHPSVVGYFWIIFVPCHGTYRRAEARA